MTDKAKKELVDYIDANCAATPFLLNESNRKRKIKEAVQNGDMIFYTYDGYFKCSDVRDAIMTFNPEPTEGCTCEKKADATAPNYEKLNAELQKELDYWKTEHCSLREHNIRLEAIVRTIEALTGKNLMG